MTDPIKAEPVAWMYELAGARSTNLDGSKTYTNWRRSITNVAPNVPVDGLRNLTPLYTEAQLVEARRLAWNEAIEAAAAYVDGNGGTVIPGATVFAALVSGNFQPCMSGDARDRLPPHTRRRFDAATHTLTQAIRALTKDTTHD